MWEIWGYAPNYAQSFLQNAIFWTVDGQRENAITRNRAELGYMVGQTFRLP